ncbi:MAG TPA: DUF4179 domain-containing protein, partial [Ktedonobacteraceae bacterium]|nr:DUF4179 domain-containing protein [Ktedonobacteraceae bacterium]
NIHQTKTIHGATISLDKGYADSNQLIIGYTVSPANAHISFQAINLSTQQGVVLNQKGNDIIVGTSNSNGNTVATAWFFSTSSIPGKPGTLALRLSMVIGQTATLTKKAPVKTLATVNFDFTLPFHVGRVATLSQKATSHGKTITLERVTVSQAATRIVVQGLGTMDSMNGGLAGTLQVPWNWRSYNYGTASPGADGPDAWSFVYPYDFSQNQGGWTLTIQQGIYTWTFHFSVPM